MSTNLQPAAPDTLAAGHVLLEWTTAVIARIPTLSDDRVIEVAAQSKHLEEAAYRVRGACAAEIKRRVLASCERDGGRTNGSPEHAIGKALAGAAARIGVSVRTLEDDAKIHHVFGETSRGDTDVLDREHYRIALAAHDPQAAADLAFVKRVENPSYSTRDFRRDVEALNAGASHAAVEQLTWVSVGLDAEQFDALRHIRARQACSSADAVRLAVVEYAREMGWKE